MNYSHFADDGQCLKINTAKTPVPWINLLFNDEYTLNVSQRLCGASFSMHEYKQKPVLKDERYFYVTVGEKVYHLCAGEGITYECAHYMHKSVVTEDFGAFTSEVTVFVPQKGKQELWQIKLINKSDNKLTADVFAGFPFANIDCQGLECHYDREGQCFRKSCFPYYITYSEYDAAKENIQYSYAASKPECTSYECNVQRFFGGDNPYDIPDMVKNRKGSCKTSEFEDCIAAFHHHTEFDDEIEIQYLAAQTESADAKAAFPAFVEELKKSEQRWNQYSESFRISNENKLFEYMVNYWLKKQVMYLTKFNRGGVYCPVRNQLQDALGYAMIDPKDAFQYALRVLKRQEENGYLKQWYMTDGSPEQGLCRINHSDAPIWLVMCMTEIILQTEDTSLFEMKIRYFNSKKEASILEHLKNAVRYMCTQLGEHGLCLMKDGDWTDPINGAGRLGKGESTWNTMALIYAIRQLNRICGDDELTKTAQLLSENVNQYCWDKDRFIVGFDDNGIPFGKNGDIEGNLFLNTQVWALIAGICDEERKRIVYETIETMKTERGYLLLTPAFSKYNSTWGKISVKQMGATENGSLYSHANMFKAYADCINGNHESAQKTIDLILPQEGALQAPLYLPNYYFGIKGDNFGRSSRVYSSGAPAWLLWIAKKYF